MRVLCCLDGTNIEALSKAITTMLRPDTLAIGLLYVIDNGPHGEMERQRERFLRQAELAPGRREQIRQAVAFWWGAAVRPRWHASRQRTHRCSYARAITS